MDPGRKRKIRALTLTPRFPFPPHDGFNLRVWNLSCRLAKYLDQTLACLSHEPIGKELFERCSDEKLRVEVIMVDIPNKKKELIKKLSFLLKPYPIWTASLFFPDMVKALEHLVQTEAYDIIVLESTWLGVYWPLIAHHAATKILDLHDLEGEKIRRQASILPFGPDKLKYRFNAMKFGRFERYLVRNADLVFVPSEREKRSILAREKKAHIEVIPNGVDTDTIRPLDKTANQELLFVGRMEYFPNVDGVLFFVESVFLQLIRMFSGIKFWIVGKNPVPEIKDLETIEGIEVTGEVDDLEPYYRRCSICVVPLRAGSGTRLKILEAMAYGKPVVSTSLGCEGIDAENGTHILIADNPDEMIASISRLFSDQELGNKLAKQGRALVKKKYSWRKIADEVYGHYESRFSLQNVK